MAFALAAYYVTCTSEASSNLARFDGIRYGPGLDTRKTWHEAFQDHRQAHFGPEVRRRYPAWDVCPIVRLLREILCQGPGSAPDGEE